MEEYTTCTKHLAVKIGIATLKQWNASQVIRFLASLTEGELQVLTEILKQTPSPENMLWHDWSGFLEDNKAVLLNDGILKAAMQEIPPELLQ